MQTQSTRSFFSRISRNEKILCMDIGAIKTGLAYTDNDTFAFPLNVIPTEEIYQYIDQYNHIVLGWPLENDGSINQQCDLVQQIYLSICNSINVILWDERFTTKLVEKTINMQYKKSRKKRPRKNIDNIAACIILESLLLSRSFNTC